MLLADAEAALGRLAGAGRLMPSPQLLAHPYLRREAVASTRIEGTDATLTDVYEAEASTAPLGDDVEEVVNYVDALEAGIERLQALPISVRLIREMHEIVLSGVRGHDRQPVSCGARRTGSAPRAPRSRPRRSCRLLPTRSARCSTTSNGSSTSRRPFRL